MHQRTWATLLGIKEASGSQKALLATAGVDSAFTRSIYGVPVFLSSQLDTAETRGTNSDTSSAYVIDGSQCVLVLREDVSVEVNAGRLFNSAQSEVRAIMRADLVVPNPTGVVRIVGLLLSVQRSE